MHVLGNDAFVVRDLSRPKLANATGLPEYLGIDASFRDRRYLVPRVRCTAGAGQQGVTPLERYDEMGSRNICRPRRIMPETRQR